MPFLNPDLRHPIRLPDGTPYENTVWLRSVIDHPNIEVGDFTYYNDFDPVSDYAARIAPYLYPGAPEKLFLGKFGQFAHGVRFITDSANHAREWFTAYPFASFDADLMPHFATEYFENRRDTVIGHDAWIGHGAMILPGVTVGHGAIIGAGAVVAKNVPPYAVMAGNPARCVKMRFPPEVIDVLLALAWWDMAVDDIRALMPILTSADVDALKQVLAEKKSRS
ncbi:CatB-related O-acetyltransferase [Pacificibacter marinus]|uniref:Chloramphenicol acetyltransferase n=1 Tax=Pacificibacter marinus TaxID=658057 RepID=A0A1Y5S6T7_9RHOB|nr:CatB-related O-acetyltransferase [Pacificibacter marinus]SEL38515.1 virginiamycin A acetyltransferase [Pacificibacter marinus]SLN32529.1 Chloramphenicol acetyltransferase [Pacificibacter marinus]